MEAFEIPRTQYEGAEEGVVRQEFESERDFHDYLSEYYFDISSNELYIVSGVTELTKDVFEENLEEKGWMTEEEYGVVKRVSKPYGDEKAVAYLYFNQETQVFFFYTDQRKTEEIDNELIPLLEDLDRSHYLYISPRVLRNLTDKIAEEHESAKVTEFIAKRTKGTKIDSETSDQERTINYYSDDGLKRLREMEEKYGVLPHILEITIPKELTFRINKEGVFKLRSGSLSLLFEYIEECLEQTLEVKRAYDTARTESIEISENYTISQSVPARIEFTQPMTYEELTPFKSNLRDSDYALIDSRSERGSLYFSSKVYDQRNNLFFNVRADENAIRIFPKKKNDISTFFRFFEIVQLTLDDRARAASVEIEAS